MDVNKIATLAKLKFSDSEQRELEIDLEKILSAFDKIKSVNTEGVEPLVTPIEVIHKLRADVVKEVVETEELLELAPEASGRLYQVPRVIS